MLSTVLWNDFIVCMTMTWNMLWKVILQLSESDSAMILGWAFQSRM